MHTHEHTDTHPHTHTHTCARTTPVDNTHTHACVHTYHSLHYVTLYYTKSAWAVPKAFRALPVRFKTEDNNS